MKAAAGDRFGLKRPVGFLTPRRAPIILGLATLVFYARTFFHAGMPEDRLLILYWPLIQSLKNLPRFFFGYISPGGETAFYAPVKTFMHAVMFLLVGPSGWGYRLFALLVHTAGVLTVYALTRRLTADHISAFLAGWIFAVHPVQVESVAWISASFETAGFVLGLLAFHLYVRGRPYVFAAPSGARVPETQPASLSLKPAWFVTALAVLSHPFNSVLPLVYYFYEVVGPGRREGEAMRLRRLAGFFGLPAAFFVLRWLGTDRPFEGAWIGGDPMRSLWVGALAFGRGLWLLLWPWRLSLVHPLSPGIFSRGVEDCDAFALAALGLWSWPVLRAVILGALIWLGGRCYGRRRPLVFFGVGWMMIWLSPLLQVPPHRVFFAERFLYPAVFGLALTAAVLLRDFWSSPRSRSGGSLRTTTVIVAMLFLVGFPLRSFVRMRDWGNPVSLYEGATAVASEDFGLWHDLGVLYLENGRIPDAQECLRRAIHLDPDDPHLHYSLAEADARSGDFTGALRELDEAVALQPDFAEAYYNAAGIHLHLKNKELAGKFLNKAVETFRRQGRHLEAGRLQDAFWDYGRARERAVERVVQEVLRGQVSNEDTASKAP